LNTLLLKLSLAVFGKYDWAFRIHILLAFGVCFYFTGKIIAKSVQSKYLYVAYIGLFFLNPYLLDFFSIAGGYALSMAAWAAARYFLMLYDEKPSAGCMLKVLTCLFLAVWGNFSALYFLPLFGGLLFYFILFFPTEEAPLTG
jgi:hypothetical protein